MSFLCGGLAGAQPAANAPSLSAASTVSGWRPPRHKPQITGMMEIGCKARVIARPITGQREEIEGLFE
ncbi:hypothetical protein PH547_28890 [Rhizobium sp. CNPSo 3464]|uniref:hypothetical protein n=1 Tax=Rhizobium sp. CNPSo 3464 TaxID=3021406 RepID=UPI00254D9A20|nr:hypothetical protein [Rhizobium sp. CNPSo 3464]MDK4742914.1 hypothetical protein [Rhizobium sp. CNPSo 3464]